MKDLKTVIFFLDKERQLSQCKSASYLSHSSGCSERFACNHYSYEDVLYEVLLTLAVFVLHAGESR